MWYGKNTPSLSIVNSKSILHSFFMRGDDKGLTINPYKGCQHRCGYCYATYEWSPEFYDHIYAKFNAADLLSKQLQSWKSEFIKPVMISSATDAYQPAELKYCITKQCVEVLQKFDIPYYIFTKSKIIERDLELHKRYSDKCFIVWSITTINEELRRIIEPGTPASKSIFKVIEKFSNENINCVVNIDPILPLITDSKHHIKDILINTKESGANYVSGAILRLRFDIWERFRKILNTLKIKNAINEYEKIFKFQDSVPIKYNLPADSTYSLDVINVLREESQKLNLRFGFPILPTVRNSMYSRRNFYSILDFM